MTLATKTLTGLAATTTARASRASSRRLLSPCPGGVMNQLQARSLQTTSPRATDGVFRGLLDNSMLTPWIEAFHKQQAGQGAGPEEPRPVERDLSPRKMSSSYHRVVLPLGRDPWLSDTYINSSGHIRYGRPS